MDRLAGKGVQRIIRDAMLAKGHLCTWEENKCQRNDMENNHSEFQALRTRCYDTSQ
jgi:hypothetical protein